MDLAPESVRQRFAGWDASDPPRAPRTGATSSRIEDALEYLTALAHRHRAVRHPFFDELATGAYDTRMEEVAATFAHWYSGYTQWFPYYVKAVIQLLHDSSHGDLLRHDLGTDRGASPTHGVGESRIVRGGSDGVSRSDLFDRFRRAMGVRDDRAAQVPEATRAWRERFLGSLRVSSEAYAVGALGLGTEAVASSIYPRLLRAFHRIDSIDRTGLAYFYLHRHVDDRHEKELLQIARSICEKPGALDELGKGMRDALEMRAQFWDKLQATCRTISGGHA
ncbi:MAG: iron-containing redox enzyme family protein [Planctomycetota bacterium]